MVEAKRNQDTRTIHNISRTWNKTKTMFAKKFGKNSQYQVSTFTKT